MVGSGNPMGCGTLYRKFCDHADIVSPRSQGDESDTKARLDDRIKETTGKVNLPRRFLLTGAVRK